VNIVPKETDSTFDIRRDIIGTGPFVPTEATPSVGYTFERNPEFYEKDRPFVDRVEMPIVPEYATQVAQLKAGRVLFALVKTDELLPLKREVPALNLVQTDTVPISAMTSFGWLPEGRSPFMDERVRQAFALSLDRNLWIDTIYGSATFEAQGVPVERRWNSSVKADLDGWLDPRDDSFGPNARYYFHNVAEARKLMAAAGYANGIDIVSTAPASGYGITFPTQFNAIEGMAAEAGFRMTQRIVDYTAEFIPRYRASQGRYEGVAHRSPSTLGFDAVTDMLSTFYSRSGENFFGFSATGPLPGAGDPYVDAQIEKASAELDRDRRVDIAEDLQRHLARTQYTSKWPGGSSAFLLAWPALRNFYVYRNWTHGGRPAPFYYWIDEKQPPFKQS
jgi:ABC-type transport system substrate-binding protein